MGRPVFPGVAVAPARLITPHDLAELHHSHRHMEADRELKEIFRSSSFKIHSLSDLSQTTIHSPDDRRLLEVTFWSAVNEVLETRGSGIVFCVASVISRYLRSAIFSVDTSSREEYQSLAEIGKSILAGLLRFRQTKYATSESYVVLAASLSLQEAVSLEPRIVGYAIGSAVDAKIRFAAEILGVPAVAGLEGIEEQARDLGIVRLDGSAGCLERVGPAEHHSQQST